MIKKIQQTIGASFLLASLSSCTVTPEQAANLELLYKIYGTTVQIGGDK